MICGNDRLSGSVFVSFGITLGLSICDLTLSGNEQPPEEYIKFWNVFAILSALTSKLSFNSYSSSFFTSSSIGTLTLPDPFCFTSSHDRFLLAAAISIVPVYELNHQKSWVALQQGWRQQCDVAGAWSADSMDLGSNENKRWAACQVGSKASGWSAFNLRHTHTLCTFLFSSIKNTLSFEEELSHTNCMAKCSSERRSSIDVGKARCGSMTYPVSTLNIKESGDPPLYPPFSPLSLVICNPSITVQTFESS